MIKLSIIIFTVILLLACHQTNDSTISPIDKARNIADRIIDETVFETELVDLKPVSGIQIVDFNNTFGSTHTETY
ncbi:MAG: hypothetical protein JSW63_04855, partial [Ignavibacterium sp.]